MSRLFIISLLFNAINAANILGLMGVASPSHHQWNHALMDELAVRGNNVTVLSANLPTGNQKVSPNLHYIHLENLYKFIYESNMTGSDLDISEIFSIKGLNGVSFVYEFALLSAEGIYSSIGFNYLLNYPDDFLFDVVVYDYCIGGSLLGFLEKFKHPPLIGATPFLMPPITEDLIGSHLFPAYIPHWLTEMDVDMNFLERVENFFIYYKEKL